MYIHRDGRGPRPPTTPGYAAQVETASATPTPAPSTSGGPPPAGATVQVSAVERDRASTRPTLTAPADAPLTIEFANDDPSVPHNVSIKGAKPDGKDWIGLPLASAGHDGRRTRRRRSRPARTRSTAASTPT